MPRIPARIVPLAAACAITVYAGLLRLDAFEDKYGPLTQPAWARMLTTYVEPVGEAARPYDRGWAPVAVPYVGGDPINYLRFAREMTSFYQAHVREPVFLAMTRACLWLLGGQDAAVSAASLAGSVAAVAATYLLAAALLPAWLALVPTLLMAIEYEVITWSVDGWRDDTFTAAVVLSAWSLLRLRDAPTHHHAVMAGVCAGVACLTRITALSFVVPALAWIAASALLTGRREAVRRVLAAGGVLALVAGPYLVNCALATGDPFYAINYHTVYYRHGEGQPATGDVSAAEYIGGKFAARPLRTLDTGVTGLFVQPFVTKWGGLEPSIGGGRHAVMWASLAGLIVLPWAAPGRLLLLVLAGSLLPYAFTWNIGDGGAWRFTMHAYPFFLVAACWALHQAWRALAAMARGGWRVGMPARGAASLAAVAAVLLAAAPAAYNALPWLVVREALAAGEDVSIETGGRDGIFYADGWSPAHREGITVRVATGARATVRLPLPSVRPYDIVVRADPADPLVQKRLQVLFNRHYVASLTLGWNPERVGAYRFTVHPEQVRVGRNDLTLVTDTLVQAGQAGARFGWLPPAQPIGVRLWYVRVLAEPGS